MVEWLNAGSGTQETWAKCLHRQLVGDLRGWFRTNAALGCTYRLTILGVLITLAATAMLVKARQPGALHAHLGWMSEQWLAEHRASHPS
jgi:hypothetical protein